MAMTAAQYLATLPPAEQEAVNASLKGSGSTLDQWYQAAINAGDPRAVEASGGVPGSTEAEEGGKIAPFQNAAPASEWLGKRKPTPQELRKWAHDTGRSEDYNRYADNVVSGWLDRNWDVTSGTFKNNYGDKVDKPDERGPNTPAGYNGTGGKGDFGDTPAAGEGGPAAAATEVKPAEPTTFGNQLSYTGNPLTDMLLYQFNQGTGMQAGGQPNIFGLGEDRAVGGTGTSEDTRANVQGQLLKGGGLWWGQGTDTFGGFRADTKNAEPAAAAPAAPPAPNVPPAETVPPAGNPKTLTGVPGGAPQAPGFTTQPVGFGPTQPTPTSGMLLNAYRPKTGGYTGRGYF